jgi:hypothetical protein
MATVEIQLLERGGRVPIFGLFKALSVLCLIGLPHTVQAQGGFTFSLGGGRGEPALDSAPPALREFDRRSGSRNGMRKRMIELRQVCEDGDRRACVRLRHYYRKKQGAGRPMQTREARPALVKR